MTDRVTADRFHLKSRVRTSCEGVAGLVRRALHVSAPLHERDHAKFQKLAKVAKGRCPISPALKVPITMSARLEPVGEPVLT